MTNSGQQLLTFSPVDIWNVSVEGKALGDQVVTTVECSGDNII